MEIYIWSNSRSNEAILMKASEINLIRFLSGPKQFVIPIYQRTYSWQIEQCEQLWRDIIQAANNENISGHFIGSIVYVEKGAYQVSAVPQLLVIDGQQRLTTILLLLSALSRKFKQLNNETEKKKIESYFFFNNDESEDYRFKLVLTKTDTDTLHRILEEKEIPNQYSVRIVENFDFFREKIESSKLDPTLIHKGISKLILVDISLNREHDNPQLIFESMNSTGLGLSQADLIRNFVLMGLDINKQTDLYRTFWYPMEQGYEQEDYSENFNRFMRDYLTLKTGDIPKIDQVYAAFKAFTAANSSTPIEGIVSEIYKYSKYFVQLVLQKIDDEDILKSIIDINELRVDVTYPFLLELFDDFKQNKISKEELIEIIQLIQSYVFRRSICGIPTNSLNLTFANLSREIDKSNYLESTKAVLVLKDSYRRFPTDGEFIQELKVKDIYSSRTRNYLLRKIENFDRKELVNIESYTIEHILPQNPDLSEKWKTELGSNSKEVQEKYLHTIGNLTLTGYNSELSDSTFIEKRDMKGGFRDSPIRLNSDLGKLEHWNEHEILKRAEKLAQTALKIWPYPSIDPELLKKYRKSENKSQKTAYSLQDHIHLKGGTLDLFKQFEKRVLNLDPSIREEVLKLYVAFKTSTNFVDVIPRKNELKLAINMHFEEIRDPKHLCQDVTGKGRWGNGDVEVILSKPEQLEDIMELVKQSYQKHAETNQE